MLRTASRTLHSRLLGGLRLPSAAAQQRTYSANVEEQLKEDLLKAALIHVPTLVCFLTAI